MAESEAMTERLNTALKRLPEDLQDQVADFADYLTERRKPTAPADDGLRRLDISGWAGKLKPSFPGETGVDLAHEALAYRAGEPERDSEGHLDASSR